MLDKRGNVATQSGAIESQLYVGQNTETVMRAMEIGEMVIHSQELAEYEAAHAAMNVDLRAQALMRRFQNAKDRLSDAERWGQFHPHYQECLEAVQAVQAEMDAVPAIKRFRAAEDAVDNLLFAIATMLANQVSDSVKVPHNGEGNSGGCASGGACNCGSAAGGCFG
jgi:cell fate (sporulation/competence/biofilm development) regulator YlbF (YheA/YmcA/DUF963 family)